MFHKAAIALAITLVMGSLSAARAEDPDEDVVGRFHSALAHWQVGPRHHAVPFSEQQRPRVQN
jgi:hypothetical protein